MEKFPGARQLILEQVVTRIYHYAPNRKKWEKTSKDLCVGDLVLIADNQLARHAWKLGRVVDIEGDATHIRKAMVKRADGKLLHRDRTKLVHLELDG